MTFLRCFFLCVLFLSAVPLLADCLRVPGQEDDRQANAGCLILNGERVLLLTHRWSGKLGVPGGTREDAELAQCTAARETHEETGLAVRVGRRLQVMKNGFHLYRCYPQSEALPETLPVPASGFTEVRALGWHDLEALEQDQWRFPYQFELFRDVASRAIRDEKTDRWP